MVDENVFPVNNLVLSIINEQVSLMINGEVFLDFKNKLTYHDQNKCIFIIAYRPQKDGTLEVAKGIIGDAYELSTEIIIALSELELIEFIGKDKGLIKITHKDKNK